MKLIFKEFISFESNISFEVIFRRWLGLPRLQNFFHPKSFCNKNLGHAIIGIRGLKSAQATAGQSDEVEVDLWKLEYSVDELRPHLTCCTFSNSD